MENRCECCGAFVAEGQQVCPVCCGISAARTKRAQRELKEALDRLSEATINAIAALERLEMVTKEGRAKNGRRRVDKDHH
jgi:hypothetical protein